MDKRTATVLRKVNSKRPQYHKITESTDDNVVWTELMRTGSACTLESMENATLGILKFVRSETNGFALVKDYIYGTVHLYKLGG